jgi:hypothetical protein
MKKFLLLFVVSGCISVSQLKAQDDQQRYYHGIKIFEYEYRAMKGDSLARVNKIQSMQKTEIENRNGKEKITGVQLTKFDDMGRIISYESYNRKGTLTYSYYNEYNAEGYVLKYLHHWGKRFYKEEYELSQQQKPVKITSYYGHSFDEMHITGSTEFTYDADGNKTSALTYDHSHVLTSRVAYEYNPDNKIGKAFLYDKSDKLVHSWNFVCDPKGAVDKKGKEEKICNSRVEMANGHIQEITIEQNKNNIVRRVREYDPKGLYSLSEEYRGKLGTTLYSRSLYQEKQDTSVLRMEYYYSGTKRHSLEYMYSIVRFKSKYLSTSSEYYLPWRKLSDRQTQTYSYNSYGMIETQKNRDEIRKRETVSVYTYLIK